MNIRVSMDDWDFSRVFIFCSPEVVNLGILFLLLIQLFSLLLFIKQLLLDPGVCYCKQQVITE